MSSSKSLLITALIVCCFGFLTNGLPYKSSSSTEKIRDAENGRLPRQVIPFHYNIEIAPDFYGEMPFPFSGTVQVDVRCHVASSSLVLNYEFLTINSVAITVHPESPVQAPSPGLIGWIEDPEADFLTLNFINQLVVNATYTVTVSYAGVLPDPTQRGIYYDYYTDAQGVTKYVVATQLESIFARRVYPSFDEPDLKATFDVTVLRKEPAISVSNMNLLRSETRADGWIADFYATSPVMSTYQVCICIGEFKYVETNWQGITNYPVGLYARQEMLGNLAFAARLAPLFQAWLEQETGIPYTLPKMDHIALPSKGGAMENWGLITYGESSFCINPETSAASGKLSVASIIAHELAHQWYGNLVTCNWWNDIWLNEGFATNYNYYPTESIGWPASEGQQADPRRGSQQFFDLDQRNNSDPIIKQIDTVWQAPDSFSGSTYPKGGAMVRMLRSLLGEATMKNGFTNYLNKFSYSSAVTDDLWTELTIQAAADGIRNPDGSALDVKTVMDAWLNQMGYPLLHVNSAGDGTATVTSHRFFNPRGQTPDIPSIYNYEWNVPITVATRATSDWDAIRPTFYINIGQNTANLNGLPVGANEWFLLNPKQMYFYRVEYDDNTSAALVNQLLTDHTRIPSESRGQLIDDNFAVSRTLMTPETKSMEFTRYLGKELQFSAWNSALKHLLYADKLFTTFTWYTNYRAYLLNLLAPVFNVTGWEYTDDEPALNQLLRRDIVSSACYFGSVECRSQARDDYNVYHLRPEINSVDANNLPTVLCLGVSEGPDTEWITVFNEYQRRRSSPITEERNAYLYGLACSQSIAWLETYLNYIIRGVQIDTRDQTQALNYLIQNPDGIGLVWNYLQNSWSTVPTSIGKFTVLRNIVSTWYREEDLTSFDEFVDSHPPSNESQRNLFVQMHLLIRQNIDWVAANADELNQWLNSQLPRQSVQHLAAPLPVAPFAYVYQSTPDDDLYA